MVDGCGGEPPGFVVSMIGISWLKFNLKALYALKR